MIKLTCWTLKVLILLLLIGCSDDKSSEQTPVITPKNPVEPYSYTFYEVEITDNYQWIENASNERVINWIEQQSNLTQDYFDQNAFNEFIDEYETKALASDYLWGTKFGYYYYFIVKTYQPNNDSWNIGQYNSISKELKLFPLNLANSESIVNFSVSNNARYLAYLVKRTNNQYQWRIFDSASNSILVNNLPNLPTKTNLQWMSNHEFIYSTINSIQLMNLRPALVNTQKLFEINKDSADEDEIPLNSIISAQVSDDRSLLILTEKFGFKSGDKVWVKPLSDSSESTLLIDKINAKFEYLGNIQDKLYFLTNLSASRNRIISIDLQNPSRRFWKEVIPQSKDLLVEAELYKDQWLLSYKENAQNKLILSSLNGTSSEKIDISPFGNLSLISQNKFSVISDKDNKPIVNKTSLISSGQSFTLDTTVKSLEKIFTTTTKTAQQDLGLLNKPYSSQVHFYRSEDGSRVPLTLVSKSKLTRNMPVIMVTNNGDGTFYSTEYNPILQKFIENDGVIAIVHARGGGIYGDNWHQAAIGAKRDKIVEDLVAAQNWLFDKSYTSPDKLAFYSSTKNSDSFARYLMHPESDVGVAVFEGGDFNLIKKANSLNDSKSSYQWAQLYGYRKSKSGISNLLAIDPLANIKPKKLPSILIVASNSDKDDLKYLAKLQNHQADNNPILWLDSQSQNIKAKIEFFLKRQLDI